jgi:cellulose biosynthesis protein BcsQ
MTTYAFWNNKGGVGKSFLCFVAASEYAHLHPETDVYVIDLCPQANVSETLLGGAPNSPTAMDSLLNSSPRRTVAGYLEARLNSPFRQIDNVADFVTEVSPHNKEIPQNLYLVCGDNLLEVIAEAIRQTSQLTIPTNSWQQVISWIKDLVKSLRAMSGNREAIIIVDCNPSFAIYTQLALVAANYVVVPFTADDSSRRGIENVVALLYGIGDSHTATYAKLSFSKKAKDELVEIPKLHTFVSNRVTLYEGKASKAFLAVSKSIKSRLDKLHSTNRQIFANPGANPVQIEIPDYHSACIVAATTGTPIHRIKPGPKDIGGERVQLNKGPLEKYKKSLEEFVLKL